MRLGIFHLGWASIRRARSFAWRSDLSQGGWASYRVPGPLTRRPGLLQGAWASHRENRPHTGRLGHSQGGRATFRETGHLSESPGLSQRDQNSHRVPNKVSITIVSQHFATKQRKILPCLPHKILTALERCSRVSAHSDNLVKITVKEILLKLDLMRDEERKRMVISMKRVNNLEHLH